MSTQHIGLKPTSRNGATSAPSASAGINLSNSASLDFSQPNLPNAGKLINSLRHLGYSNTAAIKDICDNCNDAHASVIAVLVDPVESGIGSYKITVVDNGDGMDLETLDEALKLGSETERNEVADLGKFGMGLVTASLSICRRVEVITKQKDGPILHSVQDVDVVIEHGFVKHIGLAGPSEEALFEELLQGEEHGTIVVLSHCDQLQNKNLESFKSKLRKELGQTFRYFLRSGQIEMWVNDECVAPVDPMMVDEGAEEFSREIYPIEFTDENGDVQKEQVEVRLYMLPDHGIEGNKNRSINQTNQGFYLLRNFREIAAGGQFDLFKKHPHLNRFRAELFITGTLDEVVGLEFTKQKVEFKQAFGDKLYQGLKPQIDAIRKRLTHKSVAAEDHNSTPFHEEAARQIGQKSHLLAKPRLDIEKREPRGGSNTPKGEETGATKERVNVAKTQKKEVALPCRFETMSATSAGPIWDAEQQGRTLVIKWNIDHPFYQRFILDNHDNPSMVTATDFLVYSLCVAEYSFGADDDDDSYETRQAVLETIRATLSNNMRQLLA
jgi:hypothetical protein